ncbi:MAG: hypothetical protein J6U05_06200 [Neisseriaceae bacterium]|nr:hypothetical protein [Neisseriaceae bacterium]
MFVSLPKVFQEMGSVTGTVVGVLFFAMVFFAALTSCISLLEAIVASLIDEFKWTRKKATIVASIYGWVLGIFVALGYNLLYFEYKLPNGSTAQILDIFDYISNNIMMPVLAFLTCLLVGWVLGIFVALGYNLLYFEYKLPNGSTAQILDIFDYVSNSVMMPVLAFLTCLLVGWVLKPDTIIEEAEQGAGRIAQKALYVVLIRFVCPVLLALVFLKAFGFFA